MEICVNRYDPMMVKKTAKAKLEWYSVCQLYLNKNFQTKMLRLGIQLCGI